MESLNAYLNLVSPQFLKLITGKSAQFIQAFKEENFLSEEAFMRKFCGEKYDPNYYGELKSRTKKMLQALAIISQPKGESMVKKKYDFCQRNFLIGHKLIHRGERKEGIRLIRRAWNVAIEYDFVHLASELSSMMHHDHVYYNKNNRKAAFYSKKVKQYLDAYYTEKLAQDYFLQAIKEMGGAFQPKRIEELARAIEQLQGTSVKYQIYKTMLYVILGIHQGDYPLAIKNCEEALQFFEDKKGVYHSQLQFFWSKKAIGQMALGHYEEARSSLLQAQGFTHPRSLNKYLLQLYLTQNAVRSGDYFKAYELFKRNKRCKIPTIQQQFAIIEAYLCFLASLGYLQLNRPFRLGKYLNDTFKAQSDKQGDNISILIAELLVLLSRDRGKFIDRIEAVQNYSYRYLRGKDTQRAKWFIKILCLLPAANFHPVALSRKAKRYIDLLKNHPIHLGENFTIEIIPFEDLLDMVIMHLERKVA